MLRRVGSVREASTVEALYDPDGTLAHSRGRQGGWCVILVPNATLRNARRELSRRGGRRARRACGRSCYLGRGMGKDRLFAAVELLPYFFEVLSRVASTRHWVSNGGERASWQGARSSLF